MASITDVVKEGLKYPFNDGKKVLTLGIVLSHWQWNILSLTI